MRAATRYTSFALLIFALATGCSPCSQKSGSPTSGVSLHILGTIQDAGSPQLGCRKECCRNLFLRPALDRKVVALGVVDAQARRTYLFDATPDLPAQAQMLAERSGQDRSPDAVFLTHAHIGHYTGLMYFGRESMGADHLPVYAMPRMRSFLTENGPWSQLVELGNIALNPLHDGRTEVLSPQLEVTPFFVPHRDEFSETVGYKIQGPNRTALFIPDIDKWDAWGTPIEEALAEVELAFLDGTFYDGEELGGRDMSQVPHPTISKTVERLSALPWSERNKVHFIHFNHTNPVLRSDRPEAKAVEEAGFHIARFGERFEL